MKIFEISFGRTGTTSLSKAMQILGYRVLHGWGSSYDQQCLRELINGELPSRIDEFDFISDIAAPFFRELDKTYPGSKFILLVREEDAWLNSWINHALGKQFQPTMNYQTFYRMLKFGCFWPHQNPERVLQANREHRRAVEDYFRDRPHDLLVMDICRYPTWDRLCDFLDQPIPDVPFPHENRGRYLHSSQTPRISHATIATSQAGKEQPETRENITPAPLVDKPRILFASYHCYLDPSSGAALSTRDMLEMLAARGWPVRVFCGPTLDHGATERVEQIVGDLDVRVEKKLGADPSQALLHCSVNKVETSIYCSAQRNRITDHDAQQFLALCERVLDRWKPDILVTYGGRPIHPALMQAAKRRGVRVVFSLRNFAYRDASLFKPCDAILVPSRFSADHYRQTLGLDCTPIPSPIIWSRVQCEPDPTRRFVTFINPQRGKGVQFFARIAAELSTNRPDIPLLVVESRGDAKEFEKLPIDLSGCANLHRMANTPDPRDFYRVSYIILMPSLWNESFGRVPVEAMINGIPVIASDRGSLPEVIGDAGFLFPISPHHTPRSWDVPTAEEIQPWISLIIPLWDDEAFYNEISRRSRQAAEAYREDRVAEQYLDFFRDVLIES